MNNYKCERCLEKTKNLEKIERYPAANMIGIDIPIGNAYYLNEFLSNSTLHKKKSGGKLKASTDIYQKCNNCDTKYFPCK